MRQVTGISAVSVMVGALSDCAVTLEMTAGDAQDVWIHCDDPTIALPDGPTGSTWPRKVTFVANQTFATFPVYGVSQNTTTLYSCEYGDQVCTLDGAWISNIVYVSANIIEGIGQSIPIAALTTSPSTQSTPSFALLPSIQSGQENITCILELRSLPDPTKPPAIAVLDVSNRALLSPLGSPYGAPSPWPYVVTFPPNSRTATVTLATTKVNAPTSVQIFASNYIQANPFKPAVIIQRITLK